MRRTSPFIDDLLVRMARPGSTAWLLFFLSFLLRYPFMNAGLFHLDEVMNATAVEESARLARLAGGYNGRYGTVILNLAFFLPYRLLGGLRAEPVLLLTAALAGAGLVALFYRLVLESTADRTAAIAAALMLAFNGLFLSTSTTSKEYYPALMFLVLGLLLAGRGIRESRRSRTLMGGCALAVSLSIHEAAIALVPVCLLFAGALERAEGRGLRDFAEDALLLLAPAAIPLAAYLGRVLLANVGGAGENGAFFAGFGFPLLRHAVADFVRMSGPMLLLFVPGLPALSRARKLAIPVAAWLGLFFYYGNLSSYGARYLTYLLPPACLVSGLGLSFLLDRLGSPAARRAAGIAAVAVVCLYGIATSWPLVSYRSAYCGPKAAALWLGRATEADAVILAADEAAHIGYYARRATLSHPVDEAGPMKAFVSQVDALVRSGRPVYATSSAFNYDRYGNFRVLAADRFDFLPAGEVVSEDYHRPEFEFQKYTSRLYRLLPAGTAGTPLPPPPPPEVEP